MRGTGYTVGWRRSWGSALLTLTGIVLLAGCGTATGATSTAHTGAPKPAATVPLASVSSGAAFDWQAVPTPPGFDSRKASTNILVPSPAEEGDPTHVTAYACDEPLTGDATPQHPTFWATHDGGAHWTQMPLPASVTGWCNVLPDQANTQNVLLGLASEPPMGGPPTPDAYYASFDGGATTQTVSSLQGKHVLEFASAQDSLYALLPSDEGSLVMSHDGMQTWHSTAPPASAFSQSVTAFWLDQHDVALVLDAHTPTRDLLYTGTEDGQHWSLVSAPGMPTENFVASASVTGQPWQLCGVSVDTNETFPISTLACSTDMGKTWQQRLRWSQGPFLRTLVLTDQGTLYGTVEPAPGNSASVGYPLFEFTPGTSAWVQRGTVAQFALAYSPSNALLWAVPWPMMGSTDPQARIFVARVDQ